MEMRVVDASLNTGQIVFLTHSCLEANFNAALVELSKSRSVLEIRSWIRVEG